MGSCNNNHVMISGAVTREHRESHLRSGQLQCWPSTDTCCARLTSWQRFSRQCPAIRWYPWWTRDTTGRCRGTQPYIVPSAGHGRPESSSPVHRVSEEEAYLGTALVSCWLSLGGCASVSHCCGWTQIKANQRSVVLVTRWPAPPHPHPPVSPQLFTL